MAVLDDQRWCAILAPWRMHFLLPTVTCLDPQRVAININSHHDTWSEFCRSCSEAIELLQVMAIVEQISWADMLKKFQSGFIAWDRRPQTRSCGTSSHTPADEMLIRYSPAKRSGHQADKLAAFASAFSETSVRSEFQAAMQDIYACIPSEAKRRLEQRKQIPLALKISAAGVPDAEIVAFLRMIGDMTKAIAARANLCTTAEFRVGDDKWQHQFPFTLKSVVLDLSCQSPRHSEFPRALAELLALGVHFPDALSLVANSWFLAYPVSEIGQVLQGITDGTSLRTSLGIEQVVPTNDYQQLSLEDCELARSGFDETAQQQWCIAVLSALSVSRDVATLSLRLDNNTAGTREELLKWFMYALFSKDSASSISSLNIGSFRIGPVDATWLSRANNAKNPSRVLLTTSGEGDDDTDDGEDDQDLGFAFVKAGTTIKMKRLDVSNDQATDHFVLQQDGRFRVIRGGKDTRDWIDIVVPCYGHCVIVCDSVDRIEQAPSAQSSLSAGDSGSITSLSLSSEDSLSLIEFIGSKLLTLRMDTALRNDDIRRILSWCPNVTELEALNMREKADEVLIEAYESGRCKIASLSLSLLCDGSEDPRKSIVRALQDPDSAVAKTLRRLYLHDFHPTGEASLNVYTKMLALNRTLEYIGFGFFDSASTHGISRKAIRALAETRGLWLPGRSLTLSQRYALLSVIRHYSPQALLMGEPPRKRSRQASVTVREVDFGRLDQCVVALVFEFAREGKSREIGIYTRMSDLESDDGD